MRIKKLRIARASSSCLFALAFQAAAPSAVAQEREATTEARRHFERGLLFVRAQDYAAALDEFELAYRTRPHYAVLYNIGQTYATLDRPVEAAAAFERFLTEGGSAIDAARSAQAKALIARHRQRIGYAEFDATPAGAELFVDGRRIGAIPLQEPLPLSPGLHVASLRKAGLAPASEAFEVQRGTTLRVSLHLKARDPVQPSGAMLRVACALPGVDVHVDGAARGQTPLHVPLLVASGPRAVTFSRAGYMTDTHSVLIPEGGSSDVACAMRLNQRWDGPRGELRIARADAFIRVTVDGAAYSGERLPAGPHAVQVVRTGFRPWEQTVWVAPHQRRTVFPLLEPTADYASELQMSSRRRKTWAAGLGVTGLAFAGGAVGTYLWNLERYRTWQRQRDEVDVALAAGPADTALLETNRALGRDAVSIERADNLVLGLSLAAGAAWLTAGALWILDDNPRPVARSPATSGAQPRLAKPVR